MNLRVPHPSRLLRRVGSYHLKPQASESALRFGLLCALRVSASSSLPSPNPLQYPPENHAHPTPPRPRNLPHPPRSPQNLPLPPPKTPRRLRQHPHHSRRIHLPLERKNR